MKEHNSPKHNFLNSQRATRVLWLFLALLPTLAMLVSLADAGWRGEWGASELHLWNISGNSTQVTVTWRYETGNDAWVVQDALAGRQSNIYTPTLPSTFTVGSVQVDSSGPVLGAVTHLDDTPPGAAQWILVDDAELTTTSHIPYFAYPMPQTGPYSRITIHNLETITINAHAQFFDPTGTLTGTWIGDISPLGTKVIQGGDIDLDLSHGEYSARIDATGRIHVGVDRIDEEAEAFSSAQGQAQGGHMLAAPMFAVNYTDGSRVLISTLVLQNVSDQPVTGVLWYYVGGAPLLTEGFTINPNGYFKWTEPPTLPSLGHVEVFAAGPVAGMVLGKDVLSADMWDYSALVVQPSLPTPLNHQTMYGPVVYSDHEGWNSRIPVVNLGSDQAMVRVQYLANSGDVLTSTLLPLPGHTLEIVDTYLPTGSEFASAKIASDRPVAAVAWSTSSDLGLTDHDMAYEMQYAPPIPAFGPRYVSTEGIDDSNDCTDSIWPCATVQHAVDVANRSEEIRVAAGGYSDIHYRDAVTQVVYISKTVAVRGGYSSDFSAWDPLVYPTILNAQGQGRVLYITGYSTPTIESLSITGGDAAGLGGLEGVDSGGGVYVINARPTFSDTQVNNNTANHGGGLYLCFAEGYKLANSQLSSNTAHMGGGLYAFLSSDATLKNNTVLNNWAADEGGGLYLLNSPSTLAGNTIFNNIVNYGGGGGLSLYHSSAILEANTITSNTAISGGGLMAQYYSDATLSDNVIRLNAAVHGGGVYLDYSNTRLANNVIADNRASQGSGMYIRSSSPRLLHTTLARNRHGTGPVPADASAVYVELGGNAMMTNTILVSQATGINATAGATATLDGVLWYSNTANYTGNVAVTHTITGHPRFAADGYHLTSRSAAIDEGVGTTLTTDIDGDVRPIGAGYDLGADEYPCPLPQAEFTWWPLNPQTGQTVYFTGTVAGIGLPITYTWDLGDGSGGQGQHIAHTYTQSNTYTVWLTVTDSCGQDLVSHTLTVTGKPFTPTYGVELSPTVQSAQAQPGDAVIYTHTLRNTGNVADSYSITASSTQGWAALTSPTIVNLSPSATATITIQVTVPATATTGMSDTATVQATSTLSPTTQAQASDTTTAVHIFKLYLPLILRNY